ncbi:MAG: symmetrical bis(5'-nucleosyl)-tetraphosphatase [Woeseiaceae bacterium]
MAIYAIGDLQGCYPSLLDLLAKINFNKEQDTLWFAGDLINRGSDSLATLRFVKSLGSSAITVLGNHDLHILAIDHKIKTTRSADLQRILDAEDKNELLHWLSTRPLLHHDKTLNITLTHAGIYPHWNLSQAQAYAEELEQTLQNNLDAFLQHMYGNKPDAWNENLTGFELLRFICNCFTRMRYCYPDGKLDFKSNGAPGTIPKNAVPWFEVKNRRTENDTLLFGHWSTLGTVNKNNVFPLDTGCVWGGKLTALRIDDNKMNYISVDCQAEANPEDYIK